MADQISSETSTCSVKFTNKWDGSDVCFLVEEKKVHANRLILSMWSPVFDKMLRGSFKESGDDEIPLPDKQFDDIVLLMSALHPPSINLNSKNIRVLLPLLQEYQIIELTERCETYLLEKEKPSIDNLLLAWQFNLGQLLEKNKAYVIKNIPATTLRSNESFRALDDPFRLDVLFEKVAFAKSMALEWKNQLCLQCMHGKTKVYVSRLIPSAITCDNTRCDQMTCQERFQIAFDSWSSSF